MNSVIEEIFDGEKYRTENIKTSEEYKRLQKNANKIYCEFIATLNKTQKQFFEELFDLFTAMQAECGKTNVIKGFKTGLIAAFEAAADV